MSIRLLAVVLAVTLATAFAPATAQVPPIPPGWQFERVVLLSRHGVRSPIQSPEELDRLAAQPWPAWPVAPGDLTPRGAELMRLMGRYYRALHGARGLIQEDDCPAAGLVAIWTDVDQRTRLTGAAVLAGLYPGCRNPILGHQADLARPDPLFRPPPSAACPMDAASNRAAILARIGGNFSSVLREYARPLATLQATLCPPGAAPAGRSCGLAVEAPGVVERPGGGVALRGPVAIGATASEIFLLESAQGLPADQVAWGRLAPAGTPGNGAVRDVLEVRRLDFDLRERTQPIARQQGSNLLAQIATTLQDGHKFPGVPAGPAPVRFAMLVGHDTNIANIASLLNLGWEIAGFPPDEASPGGALAFELLKHVRTGQRYVRLAYYAQTPEQMRQATPLGLDRPPGMVAVDLPGCSAQALDGFCPLDRFVEIANAALDPGCVTIAR